MGALSRFEAFVEGLIEGPFARLLGTSVQPVEIARRIEREMEDKAQVGPGTTYVPNVFRVHLNPDDYDQLSLASSPLVGEMVAFAVNLAQERHFTFLGRVTVAMVPDESVEQKHVVVHSETSAGDAWGTRSPEAEIPPVERTQALNLARIRGDVVAVPEASVTIVRNSHEEVLRFEREVLAIGRALDNDLVAEDPSVSRHHAEIKRQHGHYYITDLQSTNGTTVNGRRVSGSFLQDGDSIRIGNLELRFTLGRTVTE